MCIVHCCDVLFNFWSRCVSALGKLIPLSPNLQYLNKIFWDLIDKCLKIHSHPLVTMEWVIMHDQDEYLLWLWVATWVLLMCVTSARSLLRDPRPPSLTEVVLSVQGKISETQLHSTDKRKCSNWKQSPKAAYLKLLNSIGPINNAHPKEFE